MSKISTIPETYSERKPKRKPEGVPDDPDKIEKNVVNASLIVGA